MSDVLILCYHAVSDGWPCSLAVTTEAFDQQLALLRRRGYRGATFTDAVRASERRHEKLLAVTFDDAYRSVQVHAAPILARHGMPGTVFAPTAYMDSAAPMSWPGIDQWLGGPYEDELTPIGWEGLRELAAQGWEVGSHTRSHPRLTQVDPSTLAEELEGSRLDVERELGRPCTSVAYPYGAENPGVVAAAEAAGYEAGAALPSPMHPIAPLRWPRVGVYLEDSMLRFRRKSSRTNRRLRRDPLWSVAQLRHRLKRP